jgi:hypothetical protein
MDRELHDVFKDLMEVHCRCCLVGTGQYRPLGLAAMSGPDCFDCRRSHTHNPKPNLKKENEH